MKSNLPQVQKFIEHHKDWPIVKEHLQALRAAGFKAYLVGGCVRNALLGLAVNDFDIATSATPEQMLKVFTGAITVGQAFGTIIVPTETFNIEMTTFRKEGGYQDGRHPESIEFSDEKEDAIRRDFTINALFYDAEAQQVIDYVGGVEDIKAKRIKSVGLASQRFKEDKLRVLRAFRFSAQMDFAIDKETLAAAIEFKDQLGVISMERVQVELIKTLTANNPERAFNLFFQYDLWSGLFREPLKVSLEQLNSLKLNLYQLKGWEPVWLLTALKILLSLNYSSWRLSRDLTQAIGQYSEFYSKLLEATEVDIITDLQKTQGARLKTFCEFVGGAKYKARLDLVCKNMESRHFNLGEPIQDLLSGQDLLSLGLASGPALGQALKQIRKKQLLGELNSSAEAKKWVRENFKA